MSQSSSRTSTDSPPTSLLSIFFLKAAPPTDIYTLSLHAALPISGVVRWNGVEHQGIHPPLLSRDLFERSEEHTSELQSHHDLVCRLLLEKKKFDHCLGDLLYRYRIVELDMEVVGIIGNHPRDVLK